MNRAISETQRRRAKQLAYNEANGIDPQTIRKKVVDILEMVRSRDPEDERTSGRGRGGGRGRRKVIDQLDLPRDELGRLIQSLTDEMQDAARDLRFEEAARLRDEINELKRELREVG
jgi:excinuclease ABC subunit B